MILSTDMRDIRELLQEILSRTEQNSRDIETLKNEVKVSPDTPNPTPSSLTKHSDHQMGHREFSPGRDNPDSGRLVAGQPGLGVKPEAGMVSRFVCPNGPGSITPGNFANLRPNHNPNVMGEMPHPLINAPIGIGQNPVGFSPIPINIGNLGLNPSLPIGPGGFFRYPYMGQFPPMPGYNFGYGDPRLN